MCFIRDFGVGGALAVEKSGKWNEIIATLESFPYGQYKDNSHALEGLLVGRGHLVRHTVGKEDEKFICAILGQLSDGNIRSESTRCNAESPTDVRRTRSVVTITGHHPHQYAGFNPVITEEGSTFLRDAKDHLRPNVSQTHAMIAQPDAIQTSEAFLGTHTDKCSSDVHKDTGLPNKYVLRNVIAAGGGSKVTFELKLIWPGKNKNGVTMMHNKRIASYTIVLKEGIESYAMSSKAAGRHIIGSMFDPTDNCQKMLIMYHKSEHEDLPRNRIILVQDTVHETEADQLASLQQIKNGTTSILCTPTSSVLQRSPPNGMSFNTFVDQCISSMTPYGPSSMTCTSGNCKRQAEYIDMSRVDDPNNLDSKSALNAAICSTCIENVETTKKPCMQCFVNDPVSGFRCCRGCSEPKCVGVTVDRVTSWYCSDQFDDGSGALLSASNTSTDPSRCTDCHQVNIAGRRQYGRQYYQDNKEERRQYYQDNKEERRQYDRQYYQDNKEERRQYGRQYYQDNKEERRQYYQDNKEERRRYHREREAAESKRLEERKKNPGTKPEFRIRMQNEINQPTVAVAPSSRGKKKAKKEENNVKATFAIVGQAPKSSTPVTVEDMYNLNEQEVVVDI